MTEDGQAALARIKQDLREAFRLGMLRAAEIADKHAPMVEVGGHSHIALVQGIAAAIRSEAGEEKP